MGTYEDMARSRSLVKIGVVLGYGAAAVLTVVRIINTDTMTAGELLGSVALGASLAAPPTLALLSLDRRPSLLPGAAIAILVPSLIVFELAPIWLAVALLWYWGWNRRPVRAEISRSRAAARVGLGFLMAAAIFALFIHLDPVCTQQLADGTTQSIDAATRGYSTGWAFGNGTTSVSSSEEGADVVGEWCTSNTIVPGEALASLLITAVVLEIGRRWPQGVLATPRQRAVVG